MKPAQMPFKYWFDYYINMKKYFDDNYHSLSKIEIVKFEHELLMVANKVLKHIELNKLFYTDRTVVKKKNILMINVDQNVVND